MTSLLTGKICTVIRECAVDDFEAEILKSREDSDVMEFRLDYLDSIEVTLGLMRRWISMAGVPVIATLRRKPYGGLFIGSKVEQLEILSNIQGAGFAFLDIEIETLEVLLPTELERIKRGTWRLIASYHNFKKTPSNLSPIFHRILAVEPDVVKIATLATSFSDNFRLIQMIDQAKDRGVDIIPVAMGELGAYSRLVASSCGALLTYAASRTGQEAAPGQLTAQAMHYVYRLNAINPNTVFYGVVGYPIGHSLSPHIHNYAFEQAGLDCRYLPLPTSNLEDFAPHLEHFAGLSVTLPHKVAILNYVNSKHESVKQSGATNTLVKGDRGFCAYNTDLEGIRYALRDCLSGQLSKVVLLGAGGAARSAALVLKEVGCQVTVLARDQNKAQQLANDFDLESDSLDQIEEYSGDLLINATPVGMAPNSHEHLVSETILNYGTVFDMVYNPLETLLIQKARAKASVVSGLDMFVGQAARQFQLWTGLEAPIQGMREVALQQLSPG